jgi:hypothetical protein
VCIANRHIPDAPGTCQAAANQCSGALPQFCETCSDGTTQCAHWDDQCNVVTCPKKQGGQVGDSCNDFACCADGLVCTGSNGGPGVCQAQCSGFLPQFCQVCSDGSTACAHFDANCNVVTCQ